MNKTDSPARIELTFKWEETDNTQIDKYIICQMMIRAMKTNKAEIDLIFRDFLYSVPENCSCHSWGINSIYMNAAV